MVDAYGINNTGESGNPWVRPDMKTAGFPACPSKLMLIFILLLKLLIVCTSPDWNS